MNWYKVASYSYVEDIKNTLERFFAYTSNWNDTAGINIVKEIRTSFFDISRLAQAEYGTEEYKLLMAALIRARTAIVKASKRMQEDQIHGNLVSDSQETALQGKIGWFIWEREGNVLAKIEKNTDTNPPQIILKGLDLGDSQSAQIIKQHMGDAFIQGDDGVHVRGTRESWNKFKGISNQWLENHDILNSKMQLPSEKAFDPNYQKPVKSKGKPGAGLTVVVTPLNFDEVENSVSTVPMKKGDVFNGLRLMFKPDDPNLYPIRDYIAYNAGRTNYRFNRQEGYFDIFEKGILNRGKMEELDKGLVGTKMNKKKLAAMSWGKIKRKLVDMGYTGADAMEPFIEKMTGFTSFEGYKQRAKGAKAQVQTTKTLTTKIENNVSKETVISDRFGMETTVSRDQFNAIVEQNYPAAFDPRIVSDTQKEAQQTGIRFVANRTVSILADEPGSGKCLSADSLVEINSQIYTMEEAWKTFTNVSSVDKEIWSIPVQTAHINSVNKNKIVSLPVSQFYRQRYVGKLRKITTLEGRVVKATKAHKFLKIDGWTNDINVGDTICVPSKRVNIINKNIVCDPNLAELLGWQIAEGYETDTSGQFCIHQWNDDVLSRIKYLYDSLGFSTAKIVDHKYIRACSIKYRRFLESNGYRWGQRSAGKRIPDTVMQSDDSCVKVFLRAFFDAEGWIDKGKKSIGTCSASRVLMMQVASLLSRFGIPHTFASRYKRATNSDMAKKEYYFLTIVGDGVSTFLDEIGFSYKRKQDVRLTYTKTNNVNRGCKPVHHLLSKITSYDIPYRHLGISNQKYLTGQRMASTVKMLEIIENVNKISSGRKQKEVAEAKKSKWTTSTLNAYASLPSKCVSTVLKELNEIKDNDLLYDKIVSIEEVDYDGYIYDLCVDDTHNYIAEDILCHNTVQAVIGADMVRNDGQKTLVITPGMLVRENWLDIDDNKQPIAKAPGQFCGHRADQIAVCSKPEELTAAITNPEVIWVIVPMSAFGGKGAEKQKFSRKINDASKANLFSSLIVDEIQTIKKPTSDTFKKMAEAINAHDIPHRIGLTGTPSDNNPQDIFSQLTLLRHPILYNNKGPRQATPTFNNNGFAKQFLGGADLAKTVSIPKHWREQSTEEQIEDRTAKLWKEKADKILAWVKTLDDERKLLIL